MSTDPVEIVRNVLKTHVIRADKSQSIEKCTGCTWIGWHHDHHLSVQIIEALTATIGEALIDQFVPKDDT